MDKTAFTLIAFLLPLLGSPIQAQNTNQPSSSATTGTPDRVTYLPSPRLSLFPAELRIAAEPRGRSDSQATHRTDD